MAQASHRASTLRRVAYGVGLLLLAAVAAVVAAFKTTWLLTDIRPPQATLVDAAPPVTRNLARVHGAWDPWQRVPYVHLELRGHIPFFPARFMFGLDREDVQLDLAFAPAEYGRYRVTLRQGRDLLQGKWDTRTKRDLLGCSWTPCAICSSCPFQARSSRCSRRWGQRATADRPMSGPSRAGAHCGPSPTSINSSCGLTVDI